MQNHIAQNTKLILTPRRAALLAGFDNQLDILVRLQAPDAPVEARKERPPYGIGLVIDHSGSMSGRPLEEAKRCAAFVVDRMRADDQISLVQFDNRVGMLCPTKPKSDGRELMQAISGIHQGGNTNLHGGWRAGADSLVDMAIATGLRRVILLSDGCANEGVTDTATIADQCRELAAKGVTTSTYGLGNDFNEELMVAMAKAGQGNHYYGDTADDLMEPFQEEFDLLANLCLKGLTLMASVPSGAKVELLNDYAGNAQQGWRLPDIAWGAEAWAVLRIRLPKGMLPPERQSLPCIDVSVKGCDLDGNSIAVQQAGLALPALNSAALGAVAEDELVVRRLAELEAAGVLTRTREAARNHDWNRVDRLLAEAEQRFAGNDWVASVVEAIRTVAKSRSRERFMKEALYSASSFSQRLAGKDEGIELMESSKAMYLRRKSSRGKAEFPPADGDTSGSTK
jgi:Ca-activated chloride channel family protein